ncbi:MAG: hypothetical protein WEE64_15630 [Dehalococcoidia bacterium]
MCRVTLFIIALLLVVDAIQPSPPWLVTLAVLSGIEAFRFRHWFAGFPAVLPLTVFVISLLLAVEAVDVTDGWLVALAVLTGLDMVRPRHFRRKWWSRERWRSHRMRRAWAGTDWDDDW